MSLKSCTSSVVQRQPVVSVLSRTNCIQNQNTLIIPLGKFGFITEGFEQSVKVFTDIRVLKEH